MRQIEIEVLNKVACLVDPKEKLVCGNNDYQIAFKFDKDWDGIVAKTALFVFGDKTVPMPFEDNICDGVAIEGATLCAIGVFAGNVRTTTGATIECLRSIRDIGGVPEAPSPEVYDKIMELLDKAIQAHTELPVGGLKGQVLKKKSNDDYDTEWANDEQRDLSDYKTKYTLGLEYEIRGNAVKVVGIGTATDKDIVIPNEYNGLPVTAIGYEAFLDNNEIETVYIPENISYIDTGAFIGCSSLKKIIISENNHGLDLQDSAWDTRDKVMVLPEGVSSFNVLAHNATVIFKGLPKSLNRNSVTRCDVYVPWNKEDENDFDDFWYGEGEYASTVHYNADICKAVTMDGTLSADYANYVENIKEDVGELHDRLSNLVKTKELAYELSANGKYYICTGIGTVTDTDIVIANEYKGLPVKEIAMAAFLDSNITSVYIPKNVNTINSGAFIGVTSLKKVVFESESQEITFWSDCFGGNNIDIIIIPSGASFNAQSSISGIKNIIFKGTVTYISEVATYGAENIYVPWSEGEVEGAPWGSADATIHYNSPVCDYVTMDGLVEYEYIGKIKSELDDIKSQIGDIDTALDELHTYAQNLINGGATV